MAWWGEQRRTAIALQQRTAPCHCHCCHCHLPCCRQRLRGGGLVLAKWHELGLFYFGGGPTISTIFNDKFCLIVIFYSLFSKKLFFDLNISKPTVILRLSQFCFVITPGKNYKSTVLMPPYTSSVLPITNQLGYNESTTNFHQIRGALLTCFTLYQNNPMSSVPAA